MGKQVGLSGGRPRLAIIADDLTGALDSAAPFADRGLAVQVATRPGALAGAFSGADIVAVSTRSREVAPDDARAAVADVLRQLPPGLARFKKIDSRLKGNIAAEIAAFPPGPLLAVPALPDFGRVVRGGCVKGWGVEAPLPVAAVLGRAAIVPDVGNAADMAAALAAHPEALVAGARGAAQAMAALMGNGGAALPELALPMLLVVGSTDPITLAQVSALRAAVPGLDFRPAPDGRPAGGMAGPVTLVQAVPGDGETAAGVAAALAAGVARLAPGVRSLVLTGGATAEACLDALGIDVLELLGDIQPGLPLSRGGGRLIVTKSGGFGDAGALLRLVREAGA